MQRRIQSLPAQLANQIAAGEVVERPASVVKELLENSIDAGADRIELEIEHGGVKLIRVVDNGRGIHRDDLTLALAPHATSKIYNQQELEQIASLGFRGEALASIASVSRFRLASQLPGTEQGWELGNEDGSLKPSPLPCGTMVEVRDLFHNTPARRKFLRSERTEFLHIEEVLKRLALSRFDIAFSLIHNGRQVFRLRQAKEESQQARRVGEVMGQSFVRQSLQLRFEAVGLRLWGWLARPSASRSQADNQYFYLNGRMIRDKLVSHAVRQAHQALLEPGRHPAYVLYLEVDPRQVDVNVHPTKHEVRFRESRLVHDFIFRALQNALAGEPEPHESEYEVVRAEGQRTLTDGRWRSSTTAVTTRHIAEQQAFYQQAATEPTSGDDTGPGKVCAILYRRYLLVDAGTEQRLLDSHAARHHLLRLHLEQMIKAGEVRSQPLLIPQTVTLQQKDLTSLLDAAEVLGELGFEIERLAESSVVIRRIPAMLRGVEVEPLLRVLPEWTRESEGIPKADSPLLIDALVKQALEATPLTTLAEAERLLRQLEGLPGQGREFWRPLSLAQLQHFFAGLEKG